MDKRSDDIRQDIEQTRASLDEKIDMLENKATEVVDQVKTTATDTIDTVKQTFDVKKQVSDRPWIALGAALAAGYILGNLGNDKDESSSSPSYQGAGVAYDYNQHANSGPSTMDTLKAKSGDFLSQFDDEIDLLKVAAMTTLSGFIRDSARDLVPALGPQIERLLKERGMPAPNSSTSQGSSASGFTPKTYSSTGTSVTAGASSGTSMSSDHGSFTRTSAPNASMDTETNAGKVNNDAIPQMNRYGMPPPTPSRDDQDFYTTYQPGEDDRTVGGGDKI